MNNTFPQGKTFAASPGQPNGAPRRFETLRRTLLICSSSALLFGCGNLAKNYVPSELMTASVDKSASAYVTEDERVDLSKVDLSLFDGTDRKTERARFIATLITLSDKKCEAHKATIMSNANNWNVATGVATIIFAGYASIANSATAAANSAAAAAATTGIQGQVNQEVYQGKLSTAILRAIDAARAKAYAKVSQGLPKADYPTVQLVADVNRYHASCSLMAGVTELTTAIENRKKSRAEIEANIARLTTEIGNTAQLYDAANVSALKAERQKQVMDLIQASD